MLGTADLQEEGMQLQQPQVEAIPLSCSLSVQQPHLVMAMQFEGGQLVQEQR